MRDALDILSLVSAGSVLGRFGAAPFLTRTTTERLGHWETETTVVSLAPVTQKEALEVAVRLLQDQCNLFRKVGSKYVKVWSGSTALKFSKFVANVQIEVCRGELCRM